MLTQPHDSCDITKHLVFLLSRKNPVLPTVFFLLISFATHTEPVTLGTKCWWFSPPPSNSSWYQLDVLQFNSIPTLSTWRSHRSGAQSHEAAPTPFHMPVTSGSPGDPQLLPNLATIKRAEEKPDEEVHGMRSRWGAVLSPEASVPMELGCNGLPVCGCFNQPGSSPNWYLGFLWKLHYTGMVDH